MQYGKKIVISGFLALLLAGSTLSNNAFAEPESAVKAKTVQEIRTELDKLPDWEPVWENADLMSLDKNRAYLIETAQKDANDAFQLASGYALLKIGAQQEGADILIKLFLNAKAPMDRRIDSAAALGAEGGEYVTSRLRELLQDKSVPERLQVELAKALWRLTRGSIEAKEKLEKLLESDSAATHNEAALALATFAPVSETKKMLESLVFRPGLSGLRARKLLSRRAASSLVEGDFDKISPLLRRISEHPTLNLGTEDILLQLNGTGAIDQDRSQDKFATNLLQEIIDLIRENYAIDLSGDETAQTRELERLTSTALATNAARAFAQSVGPFTAYLDEADITEMSEQMQGEYGGIGAWVGVRNGRFAILLPMYDEPAFKAGLKAMDWVSEIDGQEIKELTQKEIIKLLKGKPGTVVRLTVWRRGWNKPHIFSVTRKQINVPSVKSRMLPDNIGYIRLERFGNEYTTVAELNEALRDLHKQGMKALVLDLSNNPGGMLSTAVRVCDKFLSGVKLIVYSQGKPDVHPRKEYYSHDMGTEPNYPMAVIINGSSASASEITAGALRDHKRAILVGEKSYGKGSVQQLFWLNSTDRRTSLKLTIAKYYLPNGDCIHGKGIKPDVKVKLPEMSMASFEARRKVIESLKVSDYIRDTFPRYEKKFRELLAFDKEDPTLYPEFDKLVETLKEIDIEIDPQDLRHEIRISLFTYMESVLGEKIVVDIQENTYLQAAVTELRKKLNDKNDNIALYAWYEKKMADRDEAEKVKRSRMYPPPPEGDLKDLDEEEEE